MSAKPYLTDEELAEICRPLTQGAAQIRFLRAMGLNVERRLDGTPLVGRAHYEAIMAGRTGTSPAAANDPDNQPAWGVHA